MPHLLPLGHAHTSRTSIQHRSFSTVSMKASSRQTDGRFAAKQFKQDLQTAQKVASALKLPIDTQDLSDTLRSLKANASFQAELAMRASSLTRHDNAGILSSAKCAATSLKLNSPSKVLVVLLLLMSSIASSRAGHATADTCTIGDISCEQTEGHNSLLTIPTQKDGLCPVSIQVSQEDLCSAPDISVPRPPLALAQQATPHNMLLKLPAVTLPAEDLEKAPNLSHFKTHGNVSRFEDAQVVLVGEVHHDFIENYIYRQEYVRLIAEKWGCGDDNAPCIVLCEGLEFDAHMESSYELDPRFRTYNWEGPGFTQEFSDGKYQLSQKMHERSDRLDSSLINPALSFDQKKAIQEDFICNVITVRNEFMKQHVINFVEQGKRVIVIAGFNHFLSPLATFSEFSDLNLLTISPPRLSKPSEDPNTYLEYRITFRTAENYMRQKQFAEAISWYEKISPGKASIDDQLNHATCLKYLHKWDEAEEKLLFILHKTPRSVVTLKQLFLLYEDKCNYLLTQKSTTREEALEAIIKANKYLGKWTDYLDESFSIMKKQDQFKFPTEHVPHLASARVRTLFDKFKERYKT